jgi:hypothetical protein
VDKQRRATFRFGLDSELKYVPDLPEVGDFVTHRSELWVVSRVEVDATGALVVCERRAAKESDARARNTAMPP